MNFSFKKTKKNIYVYVSYVISRIFFFNVPLPFLHWTSLISRHLHPINSRWTDNNNINNSNNSINRRTIQRLDQLTDYFAPLRLRSPFGKVLGKPVAGPERAHGHPVPSQFIRRTRRGAADAPAHGDRD